MRYYVLSNEPDICLGMRLAGIEGEVVVNESELSSALHRLAAEDEIAVVLISESLSQIAPELLTSWKLKRNKPLLAEIPEPGGSDISQALVRYVSQAIGIRIE